jgi:hypothetical protein
MAIRTHGPVSPIRFRDQRGAVMVEYAILLSAVSLGAALALVSLGVPLMRMYLSQRTWVLLPYP